MRRDRMPAPLSTRSWPPTFALSGMLTPPTSAACTTAANASPATIVTRLRMPSPPCWSHRFEYARSANAGADAHRHHAVLLLAPAQAVRDRRGADRAGRAQRMPERDRAAERIDLRRIEAQV